MNTVAVTALSLVLALGLMAAPVLAQQPSAPEAPAPTQERSSAPSDAAKPDVKIEGTFETKSGPTPRGEKDEGGALPRTVVERNTIFGLSPTAAIVLAAALLVVVILAIVAMTRRTDTYIDTNRRL
jgi:hypothetical protein